MSQKSQIETSQKNLNLTFDINNNIINNPSKFFVFLKSSSFNNIKHLKLKIETLNENNNNESAKVEKINVSILRQSAEYLGEQVNEKRKKDEQLNNEYHAMLMNWAKTSSTNLIDTVIGKYEMNSKIIQEKYQILCDDFERISRLEDELKMLENQISLLYNDFK
jgi:hypothetical protein